MTRYIKKLALVAKENPAPGRTQDVHSVRSELSSVSGLLTRSYSNRSGSLLIVSITTDLGLYPLCLPP